jgi:hypothetical protein
VNRSSLLDGILLSEEVTPKIESQNNEEEEENEVE